MRFSLSLPDPSFAPVQKREGLRCLDKHPGLPSSVSGCWAALLARPPLTLGGKKTIIELEARLRCCLRCRWLRGHCLLSLLLSDSCSIRVGNEYNPVGVEYTTFVGSLSAGLELGEPPSIILGNLCSDRSVHPTFRKSKSPIDAVNSKVCGLDRVSHIR